MAAQVTKQSKLYVKCNRKAYPSLQVGKVYEVREQDEYDFHLPGVGWVEKRFFEVMPPTYDHLEVTLRTILTTPCHDRTCKKCGAPTPCSYHG